MRSIALLAILLTSVSAQSLSATSTQPSGSSASIIPSLSIDVTVALTTSSVTTTLASRSGPRTISITAVVPTTFNASITRTATITPSASTSPTPAPITLATKIDPAFGVLGAILIITGLPSAFWGHKNRWTSFFLIGFYTLSLVCVVLILKFGVLAAVNPPNKTLRGMFVLASLVAGVAGGGISVFFWKAAKYFIGAWGGFAFGLFVQCFRDGGLIDPVSLRWIMYIGCGVVGFVLCTIPRLHWHMLLVSTAFVGASVFMLGVDCYTTAGLKEFYLWNLGFKALFPKFANNGIRFPVSQTMQIELGLMGAVALMGGAVQLRILVILQRKLREISEEQKKRDEEAELQASERFAGLSKEREEWERDHPSLTKHGRQDSGFNSTTPLIKDGESETNDKRSSTLTFGESRQQHLSGVSDMVSPSDDEKRRRGRSQSPGALPAMDLGAGLEDDVPRSFLQPSTAEGVRVSRADIDELARKEALLEEIQTIRKSIDNLRSGSPSSASDSRSRRPSVTSRRTLSYDLDTALGASHLRPPRQADPVHARVQSIGEYGRLGELSALGASIGRPTSVPLKDANWDRYVQDRKLLQPPLGVTAPIATTLIAGANLSRVAMPSAVSDALVQRKRRESALEQGLYNPQPQPSAPPRLQQQLQDDSDDVPLAKIRPVSNVPTTILPPRKVGSPPSPQSPNNPRIATYEELSERHRQKMREMQAPLTQAEKEQANLAAAKSRWERSNAMEREAVTRRQAEQAALLAKEEKKRKSEEGRDKSVKASRGSMIRDNTSKTRHSHSRSLSADKLAALGGSSSKRSSAMKVEGWQKSQEAPNTSSTRESRGRPAGIPSPVPFPDTTTHRDDRHKASGLFRDPPN